jgi:hypothetical protein
MSQMTQCVACFGERKHKKSLVTVGFAISLHQKKTKPGSPGKTNEIPGSPGKTNEIPGSPGKANEIRNRKV